MERFLVIIFYHYFIPCLQSLFSLSVFQPTGLWHLYFCSPIFLSFFLIFFPSYFSVFFSCLLGEFCDPVFQLSNAILNVFILLLHRIIYFTYLIFHVQYFYFSNIWLSCHLLQIRSFFCLSIFYLFKLVFSLCLSLPFSSFSSTKFFSLLSSKIVLLFLKCLLIFLSMAIFISWKERKQQVAGLLSVGWVKLTILVSFGLMPTTPFFPLS